MQVRLAGIKQESVTDGIGLRAVVYFQGCPHHCLGCHNPESHDPKGGYLAETDEILDLLCNNPLIDGITLSGGEPLLQPEAALALARSAQKRGKSVWLYSGFTLQAIMKDPAKRAVLAYTDMLVDGAFILAERDLSLPFRGSRNQRLLTPAAWQALDD
ncbi:MAG TPA: anaerobic ribonucleoside-triphosphate reductase activating protein [Firmicutes bacterium]|jgi:anaerobic ribonucleoside-triphosphate reductase activating protein|nr:anaerobic ribonucleoside-triphosphate reductase activating protein [Bacillota bacterium]